MTKRISIIVTSFLIVAGASEAGTNLLLEGTSFETGLLKGFGVRHEGFCGERQNYTIPWKIDNTTAARGACSLELVFTNRGCYSVDSRVYTLEPGKKYTLSLYAKTDKPGNSLSYGLAADWGRNPVGVAGNCRLTDKWQRYSCTGKLHTGGRGQAYKNRFFFYIAYYESPLATIWIDAVQLEEGDLTEYSPGKPAEINISCPTTPSVFRTEEPLPSPTLHFFNKDPGRQYEVELELKNIYTGKTLEKSRKPIAKDKTAGQKSIPLPSLSRGSYMLEAGLFEGSNKVDRSQFIFAVITPYQKDRQVPVAKAFLGIHGNPGQNRWNRYGNLTRDFFFRQIPPDVSYQLMKDLGIHWQRINAVNPNETCREEKGEIYSEHIEDLARLAKKYEIEIMPTFGYGDAAKDDWLGPKWMRSDKKSERSGQPLFDLASFSTYVAKVLKAAPSIKNWETFNEPNARFFTPEEFFELNKTVYETIKSLDPQATVVGVSATGDLGGDPHGWMKKQIELGTADYLDIISIHGYRINALDARKIMAMVKPTGKPVWNTEFCIGSSLLYDDLTTMEVARQPKYSPEAQAIEYVRNFMGGFCEGIQRCFVHEWDDHVGHIWWGEGKGWFEYDYSPRLVVPAVDAFNELVDGAEPRGMIDLGGNNACYLVKKEGQYVVFLQAEKEQEVEIALKPEAVTVLDLMGNPVEKGPAGDANGFKIKAGRKPLYLVINGEIKEEEIRTALIKTGLQTEFFTAAGPRLGLKDDKPALVARVINEGAITGLSGKAVLEKSPSGLTAENSEVSFTALEIRADTNIFFPLKQFQPAEKNSVSVSVTCREKKQTMRRTIKILRAKKAGKITIDGAADDWDLTGTAAVTDSEDQNNIIIQGTPWEGHHDCSAMVHACWDETNLYVLAKVRDEKVMMDEAIKKKNIDNKNWLYESDCLELFFDADLMKDFNMARKNSDDFQFLFAPSLKEGPAEPQTLLTGGQDMSVMIHKLSSGGAVQAVSFLTNDGYLLEIKIPWQVFGEAGLDKRKMIGFNFAVDDDDTPGASLAAYTGEKHVGRDIQMIWSGRGLNNFPVDFGVLVLEE